MIVKAYRNLNKNCWSLMSTKTGKVLLRPHTVFLENCEFNVSEKGRQRVIKDRRKNVHAAIKGDCKNLGLPVGSKKWKEITYNPYEHKTFVFKSNGNPVTSAKYAYLNEQGKAFVWVEDLR